MSENSKNSFELRNMFGSDQKLAKITGGITKEALAYLDEFGCVDRPNIWFNKGSFSDLTTIRQYANCIDSISFSYVQDIDWESIGILNQLRTISLDGMVNTRYMDPTQLDSVTGMIAHWSKDIESKIGKLRNLQSLEFRGFGSESLAFIGNSSSIKHLDISYSRKLKRVHEVESIENLDFLWLDTNSQLTDVSPVGKCENLKTLCVTNNNKGFGYESISNIVNLEELILNAELKSLNWLSKLKKLRILRFDCKLEDVNFEFIAKMHSLQHVFYPNRRIYKTPLLEFESILKKKGYDPESIEPDYGLFRSFPGILD